MGESSSKTNVLICLGALDAILTDIGAAVNSGKAMTAANAVYNK